MHIFRQDADVEGVADDMSYRSIAAGGEPVGSARVETKIMSWEALIFRPCNGSNCGRRVERTDRIKILGLQEGKIPMRKREKTTLSLHPQTDSFKTHSFKTRWIEPRGKLSPLSTIPQSGSATRRTQETNKKNVVL